MGEQSWFSSHGHAEGAVGVTAGTVMLSKAGWLSVSVRLKGVVARECSNRPCRLCLTSAKANGVSAPSAQQEGFCDQPGLLNTGKPTSMWAASAPGACTLLLHPVVMPLQQEMTGVEVSICLFCGGEQGEELEAGTETHPQLFALLPRLGISGSLSQRREISE